MSQVYGDRSPSAALFQPPKIRLDVTAHFSGRTAPSSGQAEMLAGASKPILWRDLFFFSSCAGRKKRSILAASTGKKAYCKHIIFGLFSSRSAFEVFADFTFDSENHIGREHLWFSKIWFNFFLATHSNMLGLPLTEFVFVWLHLQSCPSAGCEC